MREISVSLMIALAVLVSQPVLAQKFSGNGLDLRHGHGSGPPGGITTGGGNGRAVPEAVTRTYHASSDTEMSPEQYVSMYSRAIDQYSKIGNQYQVKQDWDLAEKAFKYVVQVSAMRDGPGSPKMVSTFQHLVTVTEKQKKYPEAIGFQQRVVSFAKNNTDPGPILSSQIALAKLYLKQKDLTAAEDTMQEAFDLTQTLPTMDPERRRLVARTYGEILRTSGKNVQANKMEMQAEDKIAANKSNSAAAAKPDATPSASSNSANISSSANTSSGSPISASPSSASQSTASTANADSNSGSTSSPDRSLNTPGASLGSPATSSIAPSSATKN